MDLAHETIINEMKLVKISSDVPSTASKHPQEYDYGQQSHEDLLVGPTGQRNDA